MPLIQRTRELVGREDAVQALQRFLDSSVTAGQALLLIGEPGVGKTALLDAVAGSVGGGVRTVRAAGVEFEADVSFAGLNQVLGPLTSHLPQLSEHHRTALSVALGLGDGPPGGPLVIAAAALALLRAASEGRPLLMIIDDLPWLDRASARVLGFVARRLSDTRVSLLAALRTGDQSFFERAGLPSMVVHPLNDVAAGDLVRSRFPAVAEAVLRRLVEESQGIPLALLELPRELSAAQQSADEALPPTLRLGRELQTVFAARVTTLSVATRRVLLLSALDGTGDIRVTQHGRTDPFHDDLGPAERARLVSVDPQSHRLAFTHPLIRAAVVSLATDAERRAAHRTLAGLFDNDPDLRVQHLAEATSQPDDDVAADLQDAAYRVLRRGDPVAAVSSLIRAAELSTVGVERARRLTEAAWIGADVTGALGDVAELLTRARQADPQLDSSLATAVLASFVLLNGDGDLDTAHRLLVAALETTAPNSVPGHVIDEAIHTLMLVCFAGDRPELWVPFAAALRRFGPEVSRLQVLAATTFADPPRSSPDMLAELDLIIAGLYDETDPVHIVRVAVAANFVGRMGGCRAALSRVIEDGRTGGAVASAVMALLMLTDEEFVDGHWVNANSLANEGISLCSAHGYPLLAWPGRYALALLAAVTGDDKRCGELSDEMVQWSAPRGARIVSTYARHARGVSALGRGDWGDAYALLASVNPPGAFGAREAYAMWTLLDVVEAAVRSGHRAEAVEHVAAAVSADLAAISPRQAYLFAGAAAMVAEDQTALDLFDLAATMVGPHQWPFERGRLELAHGQHLRRRRSVTAARVHLSTAVELFERLGADPWAARARTELQATGQHRRSTVYEASELTPQEEQIAQLAATGMTNRQIGGRLFLSPRTVSAHLYRIFPKLGITSRAGLRDALDALGSSDGRAAATVI